MALLVGVPVILAGLFVGGDSDDIAELGGGTEELEPGRRGERDGGDERSEVTDDER